MASMSIQKAVSSSYTAASCNSLEYDVFLSFKGEDTRKHFTGHLHTALNQAGIKVFKDDKELERGKVISPALIKAIEKSRFSLIVLSRNYASSTWCLEELVKIIECKNVRGQIVIPVFYNVDPSTVRKQKGSFEEAFINHEVTENTKRVQKWKSALKEVANLSGWDANDRDESELIQEIVKEIIWKLSFSKCMNIEGLVGIESHLEKLKMLIGAGSNDTRVIGISGTGGIGKTTIARVVYDLICDEFEGSSFLANVRENSDKHGILSLQKQLLSQILKGVDFNIHDEYGGSSVIKGRLQCKKVLIVLDDVDHELQLNNLAKRDWVGLGSRIIITTREQRLLKIYGVDKTYKLEELNNDDSVRLFSLKAFKNHQPSKEYEELSMQVVKYASGIPLALTVLGSSLFDRSVDEWEDSIKRLRKIPNKKIFDVLQISFDGLEENEREIFLDLACFFKGYDRDYVTKVLVDFFPVIGIKVLVDKSLITISNENAIEMHDLLQEMGQQIVKREFAHRRLWEKEDASHVLRNNMGTEGVEAIMIKKDLNICVNAKAFSKMINLRLLKIKNVQLVGELEYLSEKLRLLEWHGYPLNSLPSSLQLDKIVDLKIYRSPIKQLPKWIQPLMLTELCLRDCPNLKEVPDLTCTSNLDMLILEGCPSLHRIHSPHLILKKLSYLEVSACANLTTLPCKISMDSLEECLIDSCPKLEKFPDIIGKMERLSHLSINGTAIKDMSSLLELLTGLQHLYLLNNRNLVTLPDSINGLESLRTLELCGCSSLQSFPTTINGLKSLYFLDLSGCFKLDNVAETLVQVEKLVCLYLPQTALTKQMSSIFLMKNLKVLSFQGSKGQPSESSFFHQLFASWMTKRSSDVMALTTFSLQGLCYLRYLNLSDCDLREEAIPDDFFSSCVSLEELNLSRNDFVSLPKSINCPPKLKRIDLEECKRLQSVPELPSSMCRVNLNDCASLETLSNAFKANNSFSLCIYCVKCGQLFSGGSGSGSLMFTMLKDFLKAPTTRDSFSMVGPGSEIPEWVRDQSVGSKIRIERPQDLYDNKLVGLVVCSVFVVYKHIPVPRTHEVSCHLLVDQAIQESYHINFSEKFGHSISEQLWLLYLSHEKWEKEYYEIEFLHARMARSYSDGVEVKRCGVHPIYEKDLQDLNPILNQSISSTSHQDFIGSTMGVVSSRQNLPMYANKEAKPKGLKMLLL